MLHSPSRLGKSSQLAQGAEGVKGKAAVSRKITCKVNATATVDKIAKREGPIIVNGHVLRSLTKERFEIFHSLTDFMSTEVLPLLKPVDKCWQPTDFLPASEDPDFFDKVRELRQRTAGLPDDYMVVFVGDMVTEEALPTYMSMLNTLDAVRDETGASNTPWAIWTRAWTAEENRHGDVMNKYMYLSGRVNMRAFEITVQNLIGAGMDPKTDNNPYNGFIYTSFQERATKISHGNTARQALEYGDSVLAKICGSIASDEGRHEIAYQKVFNAVFERDPNGAMLAYADMMRKQIVMPAHLMDDCVHESKTGRGLFADFSAVAERLNVYTAMDYADIMEYLNGRWKVSERGGLSGDAAEAQEYLMKLPDRIRKLAERASARKKAKPVRAEFSWIFNKEVALH